jgi:hypothetical protein
MTWLPWGGRTDWASAHGAMVYRDLESPEPSGQPGDLTRGGAAPFQLQQAAEPPVVAEPRPRRVQRHHERVGGLQVLQDPLAVRTPGQRVGQPAADPLHQTSPQQRPPPRLLALLLLHLGQQVVGHGPLAAGELRREPLRIGGGPSRRASLSLSSCFFECAVRERLVPGSGVNAVQVPLVPIRWRSAGSFGPACGSRRESLGTRSLQPHPAAGIRGHRACSRLASACAVVTAPAAGGDEGVGTSGPGRSRMPPMTAPPAKMPALHQNAVS